jgi:hypothetical protein
MRAGRPPSGPAWLVRGLLPRRWPFPSRRSLPEVREALRLRAWALGRLSGAADSGPPPPASQPAWELFLATEGCAAPLLERIPTGEAVPPPLRAAALLETQRTLGARRELRMLDTIAAERGWRAVVLKGGAPVAEGRVLDVADVDLLVARADAAVWERAVRARGRARTERSVPRPGLDHHHPLGAHREAGGLLVELHTFIPHARLEGDPVARSRPLGGFRALRKLAPADQAWHVLVHVTVQHPERRGRLRDLLLLSLALARLSPEEATDLGRRAAEHPVEALADALAMSWGLAGAEAPPEDRFPEIAALAYLLRAEETRLPADPRVAAGLAKGAVYGCVPAAERGAYLRLPTGRGMWAPLSWGARSLRLLLGVSWARRAREAADRR